MTTVFRKTQIGKEKLHDIILKNPEYIQPGLSFLDSNFGNEDVGLIDFLGVNGAGKLVLVNFEVSDNGGTLLIAALSQIQWIKKNESLIKRLFFSENVDFSIAPEIVMVSPEFSKQTIEAAKQLSNHELALLQYQYIIAGTEDAIFFEEVLNINQPDVIKNNVVKKTDIRQSEEIVKKEIDSCIVSPESVDESLPKIEIEDNSIEHHIELTPEEIAEFMDFDRVLEIEKSSDS